jgi:hypothetical protein
MIERRQFGRRTVCKRAKLFSQDRTWRRCIVVDISEGGARIQMLEGEPSRFHTLVIPEDDSAYACEIVNRRADQIGVRFVAIPQRIASFTANTCGAVIMRRSQSEYVPIQPHYDELTK